MNSFKAATLFLVASIGALFVPQFSSAAPLTKGGLRKMAEEEEAASKPNIPLEQDLAMISVLQGYRSCPAERSTTIPFMITNIEGVHDGDQLRYSYHSDESPVAVYFLKDVTHCAGTTVPFRPYVIVGTKLGADDFKAEVQGYIEQNGLDTVLYNLHGFNVEPESAFLDYGKKFEMVYQEATRWLLIPVQWRTYWGANVASYRIDRQGNAIRAGKLLAANAEVFKSNFTTHMMVHSMGNYVYQIMATTLHEQEESDVFFDKTFLVAADARSDMFDDAFNPDAPRQSSESRQRRLDEYDSDSDQAFSSCSYDPLEQYESELVDTVPVEECKLNGGYAMTKLSNTVHVIWNSVDNALIGRETFVFYPLGKIRSTLGAHGDLAESNMNLQYFKDRVVFHPDVFDLGMTPNPVLNLLTHSYALELPIVKIYDPSLISECRETGCNTDSCGNYEVELNATDCGIFRGNSLACCFLGSTDGGDGVGSGDSFYGATK